MNIIYILAMHMKWFAIKTKAKNEFKARDFSLHLILNHMFLFLRQREFGQTELKK